MRRRAPRPLAVALEQLAGSLAPATLIASVQRAWPDVVGAVIAAEAQPVSERDGVVRVACRSAVWAQELDLMAVELAQRLNAALPDGGVHGLRCEATRSGRR